MTSSAPHRLLSGRSAALLVVANMVGAGVFTTSGYALLDLDRGAVLLAWLVGGLVATLGALSYGALGARFPHSGGEYELLRRTLHPTAGVLAGWVSLLAGFSAPIAFAGAAFGRYLAPVLGLADTSAGALLGTAAILTAGGMHLFGLRLGARVQDAAVGVKVALIGVLVVAGGVVIAGLAGADGADSAPPPPVRPFSLGAFAETCVWVSFAYSGWNAAVYVAGEVRDATRAVPRALLMGTLLVTACYLALNAVFLWAAPVSRLAGQADVGRIAAAALFGEGAAVAVALLVALALWTSISAMTMAGPRVYARMAQDGAFPRWFADDVAHRPAVLLQLALALVMLWAAAFEDLMTYIGYTLGLSAAATVLGLVRVRLREGAERVPVPGWPWVPVLFVLAVLGISAFSFSRAPGPASAALVTLVFGGVVDAAWRRRR